MEPNRRINLFSSFYFQNSKMSAISIDPNNYKLSEKTANLTAQGEKIYLILMWVRWGGVKSLVKLSWVFSLNQTS